MTAVVINRLVEKAIWVDLKRFVRRISRMLQSARFVDHCERRSFGAGRQAGDEFSGELVDDSESHKI